MRKSSIFLSKDRFILIILLLIFFNLTFSFYLLFPEVKLKFSITKPSIELKINEDNYFSDSDEVKVVSFEPYDDNILLNIDSKGVNKLAIPISFDYNTLSKYYYNLSVNLFDEDHQGSDDYFKVYLSKAKSSCSDSLGEISTQEGDKNICPINSYLDFDNNSNYFNKISFNLNKTKTTFIDLPKDSMVLLIEVNPFYKGELNLKLNFKLEEQK